MFAATKAALVSLTRTRTAIRPLPSWSMVALTVEADAPESEMLSIMASLISGILYLLGSKNIS